MEYLNTLIASHQQILFWIIITYLTSFVIILLALLHDHLFSKWPNYYVYLQVVWLGLIPILNTYIALELLYNGITGVAKELYRITKVLVIGLVNKDSGIIDETRKNHYDFDSGSMYPNDTKNI